MDLTLVVNKSLICGHKIYSYNRYRLVDSQYNNGLVLMLSKYVRALTALDKQVFVVTRKYLLRMWVVHNI